MNTSVYLSLVFVATSGFLSRYWRVHCLLLLSLKLTFLFLAYLKALYFFFTKNVAAAIKKLRTRA